MAEVEVPRLSYSIAQLLKTKTPLHAWDKHRLLGGNGSKETKAMDKGKLMEKFVLGADLDKVCIIDADDFKTVKARKDRDEAIEAGLQPATRNDYEKAKASAEVIIQRFWAEGVDLSLVTDKEKGIEVFVQHKLTWTDAHGVNCSGVIDRLVLDYKRRVATIYDFKTTSDASTKSFTRSVWTNGYHIQKSSYEEAVAICYPHFASDTKTLFLVAENDSPFAVRVLALAGNMSELGRRAWEEAKAIWEQCLQADKWPGYPQETIEATAWMLDEALTISAAGDEELQRQMDIERMMAAGDGPLVAALGGRRAEGAA